jgi:hypothetical protein
VEMTERIPDESPSAIAQNLSSSVILSALPKDATTALAQASAPPKTQGTPGRRGIMEQWSYDLKQ